MKKSNKKKISTSTSCSSYDPYLVQEVSNYIDKVGDMTYFNGRTEIMKCLHFIKDIIFRLEQVELKR